MQVRYRYWEITGKYSTRTHTHTHTHTHVACSKKSPKAEAFLVPGDHHKMGRNCGYDTEDCVDKITVCGSTDVIPSSAVIRRSLLLVRICKCR